MSRAVAYSDITITMCGRCDSVHIIAAVEPFEFASKCGNVQSNGYICEGPLVPTKVSSSFVKAILEHAKI